MPRPIQGVTISYDHDERPETKSAKDEEYRFFFFFLGGPNWRRKNIGFDTGDGREVAEPCLNLSENGTEIEVTCFLSHSQQPHNSSSSSSSSWPLSRRLAILRIPESKDL